MSARSAGPLRSALYEGTVTHRRADPSRRFSNEVALPLLFLDELPALRAVHPLVDLDPTPHRRLWPAAMRFRRDDFLPSDSASLLDSVTDAVAGAGGSVRGPVAMLGHLRTWGWLFNPISLYFCAGLAEHPGGPAVIDSLVAEVENTPWHERHAYVVGPPGRHRFAKELHVSPFLPPRLDYELRYTAPGPQLTVGLDVLQADRRLFAATLFLRRRPLDRAALGRILWNHPAMTHRVSAGIYAQAARLRLKGAPFFGHPAHREGGAGTDTAGSCPHVPVVTRTGP